MGSACMGLLNPYYSAVEEAEMMIHLTFGGLVQMAAKLHIQLKAQEKHMTKCETAEAVD